MALTPWDSLATEVVVDHRWYRLRRDTVRLPSGRIVDDYFVSERADIALVIALTPADQVVLVHQWKQGCRAFYTELPGGMLDAGEEALECGSASCARKPATSATSSASSAASSPTRRSRRIRSSPSSAQAHGRSPEPVWDEQEELEVRLLPGGVATRCDPGRRDHVRGFGRDRLPRPGRARASVKVAVVGHVEWVEFVEVDHVPAPGPDRARKRAPGRSRRAAARRRGADAEARRRLRLLHRARRRRPRPPLGRAAHASSGSTVHVQWFGSTRRALVHVDREPGADDHDGRAEAAAGRARCRSPATTASSSSPATWRRCGRRARPGSSRPRPRELETLREGGVHLDLLVGSGTDPGERTTAASTSAVVVATEGSRGGIADGVRFAAAPPPGPLEDTYGAGDSFAAALIVRARARRLAAPTRSSLPSRAGASVDHGKGAVLGADNPLGVDRWGVVG